MSNSGSPTVYPVVSRGSVRIPAADLLVDGELSINPALDRKGYFTVHFKGRDLELVATGYCGFIPVNARVAVEVRPKMPVENLGRIFDVAGLSLPKIEGVKRRYDATPDASAPMLEFLTGEFALALSLVVDHGLKKSYLFKRSNDSNPRGRIDFHDTIRSNFARGRPDRIVSHQADQKIDIPENRLLRAAGELLLTRLRRYKGGAHSVRGGLASLLSYFSGVSTISPGDIRWLREQNRTDASRANQNLSFLDQALSLALLILDETEVEIEAVGGAVDLSAVVVDFDVLFEEYVRNSLSMERQRMGLNFAVLDGNKSGRKGLFDNRANPPAQPDVVLRAPNGETLMLLEIKYKAWPDRGDYNQAITYAASYKVSVVVLVHQASKAADAGLSEIGRVGPIKLMRYGLPLDEAAGRSNQRHDPRPRHSTVPAAHPRTWRTGRIRLPWCGQHWAVIRSGDRPARCRVQVHQVARWRGIDPSERRFQGLLSASEPCDQQAEVSLSARDPLSAEVPQWRPRAGQRPQP